MSGFIGASNSRDGVIDRSQPLGQADNPTFVAPTFTGAAVLGTPASGNLSNTTALPAAQVSGVLPSGVTGGSGLTALGTVASGAIGASVSGGAGLAVSPANLLDGVMGSGVSGGSGLTALGTVASGVIGTGVTGKTIVKAWGSASGTTLDEAFGVAGVTNPSTGEYLVTLTSGVMANADWAVAGSCWDPSQRAILARAHGSGAAGTTTTTKFVSQNHQGDLFAMSELKFICMGIE
tara:strand:- start:133 stop:837 length:705 start_codon:yes stop_codon:yes gene_type:complete